MKLFHQWLTENKLKSGLLAATLAASPLFYSLATNQPGRNQLETTYSIKLHHDGKTILYTVTFENVDFKTMPYPALIKRYKNEARDAVIDTVLDTQSLTIPDGKLKIRTASLKGLSYEDIQLLPDEGKIIVVLKQIDAPSNIQIR